MSSVVKAWIHLCGRSFCNNVLRNVSEEYNELKKVIPDFNSSLAFIEFNGEENTDLHNLIPSLKSCGISVEHTILSDICCKSELFTTIQKYNEDPSIHGIYVCQIPLKEKFKNEIAELIIPSKDVGGISSKTVGKGKFSGFVSTIGQACLELLKTTNMDLSQSNVSIIGEMGNSLRIANLFLLNDAVVTICSPNKDSLEKQTQDADIVVVMCNNRDILSKIHIKRGAVILAYFSASDDKNDAIHFAGDHANLPSHMAFLPDLAIASIALAVKNTITSAKSNFIPPCDSQWTFTPNPLRIQLPILSDIEIARAQQPKNINVLANEIGLLPHEYELYGKYKAKISLDVLKRLNSRDPGKYIVITGMTPTPFGEGKSTTTIGLCQALGAHLNKNVIACVRQPSQGPTFGVKGGAAGGGYSQIIPMEDFNLHLTGDFHAVTAANNLLAAQIDARMFHEATQSDEALYRRLVPEQKGIRKFSKIQLARLDRLGISETDPSKLTNEEIKLFVRLDIDPTTITWQRVLDTNDRFLRKIVIGLSNTEKGHDREAQVDIAVASEVMAILALSTGLKDLKQRLSKIVVARDLRGNPITSDDLGVTGAMTVLLKDALKPNLMQTLEGTAIFVHAGPFANIAHGNSSILADQIALKVVGKEGFVVTEAGFGADIGLEKFFHIKCRYSGLLPDVAVIVATVRALKMHGGGTGTTSPQSLLSDKELREQLNLIEKGFCNLAKHIENVKKFGVPVIVAVNRFGTDTEEELECIKRLAMSLHVEACIICSHFYEGGAGAKELAECVIKTAKLQTTSNFHYLYDLEVPIEEKITIIAKEIYGAKSILLAPQAQKMISIFEKEGLHKLPICMAKTQYSFSHDPSLKGAPKDFQLPIRDIKASVGAGFLYPLVGSLMLMPGLPTRPCFYDIDINVETEEIEGLS